MKIPIACATLLFAGAAHGDPDRVSRPRLPAQTEEAIADAVATSATGDETPPRAPFSQYEIGPSGTHVVSYEQLSKSEQAQATSGRNVQLRPSSVDAYGAAVSAASHRAIRDSAAKKLGLEHIEMIGVVL
jgi:hypothetical protein